MGALVTAHWVGSPSVPPGLPETQWTRRQLKDGEVMAILIYPEPYHHADENLKFIPHMSFGESGPVAKEHLPAVLTDLAVLIEDDLLPRFTPFFPAR